MKKLIPLFPLLFCAFFVKSQIPSTEIYLLDIDNHGSHSHVGKPKNISNSKGYDSQPCFSKEGGTILFTSIRNGTQADVFEYNIAKDQTTRVTDTPESEYSPTYMEDGIHFSTVRVEKDSTQRLWQFELKSPEKPERILDKAVDSVGYHCWFTQGKLALFILTEPVSLQLAEVGNWETKIIAEKAGRSMQKIPFQEAFYFVDKTDSTNFYICKYQYSVTAGRQSNIERLFPALKGSEDFCVTPEGNFIMAQMGALFLLNPSTKIWTKFADLMSENVIGITRVVLSPDGKKLAVVAQEFNLE